jgi:hypothetical protein
VRINKIKVAGVTALQQDAKEDEPTSNEGGQFILLTHQIKQ